MINIRKICVGGFLVASLLNAVGVSAQEIERGNPFEAPSNYAEEQARLDERTRVIFRQMEPDLKNDIMKRVNESQAALEIKLRKRIDLITQNLGAAAATTAQAATADAKKADEAKKPAIPDGAIFISCINKKALYRDKNNTLFQVAEDEKQSDNRCLK